MWERWLVASIAVGTLLLVRVIVQRIVTASRGGAADDADCHGGGCMRACTRTATNRDAKRKMNS